MAVALAALHARLFAQFSRNADTFSAYLVGRDLARGNWTLVGWWLPPDNFLTSDVLLYALAIGTFGDRVHHVHTLSVALWLLTAALAYALARRPGDGRGAWWSAVPVLVVVGLPLFRGNRVMALITSSPIHVGSIAYACAMLLLADVALSQRGRARDVALLSLGALAAAAVAGDPLVAVIGVAPIAVASALARGSDGRRPLSVGIASLVGALVGAAVVIGTAGPERFQVVTGSHMHVAFARFDDLGENATLTAQAVLRLFGADFFGRPVVEALPPLARAPLFVLAMAVAWIVARASVRSRAAERPPFLDIALVVSIALMVSAALASRVMVDEWSARLLLPVPVCASVLLARRAPRTRAVAVAYAVALLVSVHVSVQDYRLAWPAIVPPRTVALAEWLSERRLQEGFAPYWTASTVTAASEGRVRLRPVTRAPDRRLAPMQWLSRADWYPSPLDGRRPFVVVEDREQTQEPPFDAAEVARTFGEPTERLEFEGYRIHRYAARDESEAPAADE